MRRSAASADEKRMMTTLTTPAENEARKIQSNYTMRAIYGVQLNGGLSFELAFLTWNVDANYAPRSIAVVELTRSEEKFVKIASINLLTRAIIFKHFPNYYNLSHDYF